MNINRAGLEIIKRNEGLRLTAYQDSGGVWTIGWGHTPARPGQVISEEQAKQLLLADIAWAEDAVYGATRDVLTNENHFSAMVSLCFNIGPGGFKGSSILRKHRRADYNGAANSFLLWNQDNGRVLAGLKRRRAEERALYLTAVSDAEAPLASQQPATADSVLDMVATLQTALRASGHYHGDVDRDFGPMSYQALRTYTLQRA